MNMLERAVSIALESHTGQTDKAGKPYILHPLRLMLKMGTDEEMIAAVLHDVVEDSSVTFEELKSQGFSDNVIDALMSCTKINGENYDDFIQRIKGNQNPLAIRVKIADLQDNMDISRIAHPVQKDFDRVEKYKRALKVLLS